MGQHLPNFFVLLLVLLDNRLEVLQEYKEVQQENNQEVQKVYFELMLTVTFKNFLPRCEHLHDKMLLTS